MAQVYSGYSIEEAWKYIPLFDSICQAGLLDNRAPKSRKLSIILIMLSIEYGCDSFQPSVSDVDICKMVFQISVPLISSNGF